MTKQEARQWIREHFAKYILHSDMGFGDAPDEVVKIWDYEVEAIANRIDRKNNWSLREHEGRAAHLRAEATATPTTKEQTQ